MRTITNKQGTLARIEVCHTAQAFFNVRIDTEPPVRLQIAHAETISMNRQKNKSEKDLLDDLLFSRLAEYGFNKQDLNR
tara:strand:- start:614 stop:850 length:237 start_codon:yes stop_codon:yes gene_type:complete